jgi:uncharacterized membrane protein
MKKVSVTLLLGFAFIALFDILGSIASKQLNFNYSNLSFISFIIYTTTAFFIAGRSDKKSAIISGGLLGLFDVTVGLKLSTALKANTGDFDVNTITPPVFIVMAIFMTLIGCLSGLLGYWLSAKILTKK